MAQEALDTKTICQKTLTLSTFAPCQKPRATKPNCFFQQKFQAVFICHKKHGIAQFVSKPIVGSDFSFHHRPLSVTSKSFFAKFQSACNAQMIGTQKSLTFNKSFHCGTLTFPFEDDFFHSKLFECLVLFCNVHFCQCQIARSFTILCCPDLLF